MSYCFNFNIELSVILSDLCERFRIESWANKSKKYKPYTINKFIKSNSLQRYKLNKKTLQVIDRGLHTLINGRIFRQLDFFPNKYICDKLIDYQYYSILFNQIVYDLNKNGNNTPYHIDFCIIPPGIFQPKKKGTIKCTSYPVIKIGNIDKLLDIAGIKYVKTNGYDEVVKKDLSNGYQTKLENEFNIIKGNIVSKMKQIMLNKNHHRIVVLIDRRWRVHSNKHKYYNRLLHIHTKGNDPFYSVGEGKTANNDNDTDSDSSEYGSESSDDDDPDGGDILDAHVKAELVSGKYLQSKCDTIYIYEPNQKNNKYNTFKQGFIDEELHLLTKKCILPGWGFGNKYKYQRNIDGGNTDGWMYNLSAHIHSKQKMRWYLSIFGSKLRFFQNDLRELIYNYFIDGTEQNSDDESYDLNYIQSKFKNNLYENDTTFKRYYAAFKSFDSN